jgi:hypothetical protein
VRAAAVDALAGAPSAQHPMKRLVREALRRNLDRDFAGPVPDPRLDPDAPKLEAALYRALADEPDGLPALSSRLADLPSDTRALLLAKLTARPNRIDEVRAMLASDTPLLRAPAARALAFDPASAPAIVRLTHEDPSPALRALVVELLGAHALTPGDLGARLCDPSGRVRAATARVLAAYTPRDRGAPLAARPEIALPLEDPIDLTDHPDAEAILAWLLARLAEGEHGRAIAPDLAAEVAFRAGGDPRAPRLARLPFDQDQAPSAASVFPAHNLIEAAAVARRLVMTNAPALFLACADVAFSDLTPPSLAPGELLCGPTFFGLRLAEPPLTPALAKPLRDGHEP